MASQLKWFLPPHTSSKACSAATRLGAETPGRAGHRPSGTTASPRMCTQKWHGERPAGPHRTCCAARSAVEVFEDSRRFGRRQRPPRPPPQATAPAAWLGCAHTCCQQMEAICCGSCDEVRLELATNFPGWCATGAGTGSRPRAPTNDKAHRLRRQPASWPCWAQPRVRCPFRGISQRAVAVMMAAASSGPAAGVTHRSRPGRQVLPHEVLEEEGAHTRQCRGAHGCPRCVVEARRM